MGAEVVVVVGGNIVTFACSPLAQMPSMADRGVG